MRHGPNPLFQAGEGNVGTFPGPGSYMTRFVMPSPLEQMTGALLASAIVLEILRIQEALVTTKHSKWNIIKVGCPSSERS